MKTPENFLATSPIPVYAVALPRSDVLIYTGGGGRSRSGVSNAIRATTIKYDSHELVDRTQVKLSNEEDAPMCLAVSPGNKDEEPPLLAEEEPSSAEEATVGPSERKVIVGINSSLTQSGSNENLRLLKWSSSGYKPSSQTTAAEKLTDAIKEQVKDDAPGQNTRDEDVQEMELQSKAASIQITDLEQYVKVVAVSPNGKFLAVGGTDGQIALHSFPSLERIWIDTPIQSNETVDASFSADSSLIAFVFPRSIRIYPTSTNSPDSGAPPDLYQSIRNPNLKQTSGCVFRGARFGRSGGAGKPGRSDRFYTVVNANPASGLGSSKKDREKAKIRKCFISSWDADKWTLLKTRKISDRPATVFALSDNGKHLALSTSDLSIHILSSSTLSTIWRLKDAHAFPGTCLTFSPRGDMLVSGSADMSLRVIKVGVDEEPTIVHDWIHSKTATMILALFLAYLAYWLQQRIAPDLPMEVSLE